MLVFRNILGFPSYFKNRQNSWKDVKVNIVNIEKNDNNIIITGTSDKYEQYVIIHDKEINPGTPVSISCTCESFKFEFANTLFRNKSLANSEGFILSVNNAAKKKNPFNIESGCKHIIALANLINKKQYKITGGGNK